MFQDQVAIFVLCSLAALCDAQIAGETNGYMNVDGLDTTASGQGSGSVGAVSVQDNSGYVTFQGQNYYVLTYRPQWGFGGYDLLDALGVRQDGGDVALFYLYCQGGYLKSVWHEDYFDLAGSTPASGSCDTSRTSYNSRAYFPAITALPPGFDPGFRISGGDLSLQEGRGSVRGSDGVQRSFTTMTKVDCSECPGGPWWEIHGIMSADSDACFGILYLRPSYGYNQVQLAYSLCLPSLRSIDKMFSANWSPGLLIEGTPSGSVYTPPSSLPWRLPPWMLGESQTSNTTIVV